jgi:hypothetical protein
MLGVVLSHIDLRAFDALTEMAVAHLRVLVEVRQRLDGAAFEAGFHRALKTE